MKFKILLFALLLLPACSAISGPQPIDSEWPFGNAKSVVLRMAQDPDTKVESDNDEYIEIFKSKSFHRYDIYEKSEKGSGKIWFKSGSDEYIGLAFSVPTKDGEKPDADPELANTAHYVRFKFNAEKTQIDLEVLDCSPPNNDTKNDCHYTDTSGAWEATFMANAPYEASKHIILDLVPKN